MRFDEFLDEAYEDSNALNEDANKIKELRIKCEGIISNKKLFKKNFQNNMGFRRFVCEFNHVKLSIKDKDYSNILNAQEYFNYLLDTNKKKTLMRIFNGLSASAKDTNMADLTKYRLLLLMPRDHDFFYIVSDSSNDNSKIIKYLYDESKKNAIWSGITKKNKNEYDIDNWDVTGGGWFD